MTERDFEEKRVMAKANASLYKKKDCCGCTACSSICPQGCIQMTEDEEGFLYPVIDQERCVGCHLCEKVCPVRKEILPDTGRKAFVARIKEEEVLWSSTSGGVFTALSRRAIAEGYAVYGGAYTKDFEVVHESADSDEEAKKFRGSKYVQSDLGNTFQKIRKELENGGKVLFSGTPCQCAGLLSYLGRPYETLLMVDFVCHAVSSPKVWRLYREYLVKKYHSKIKNVNFRSKVYGYHCSSMKINMENGKTQKLGMQTDLFLKSFFYHVSCRPSCYDCHFKTVDRVSDITLFDCWSISRLVPGKKDDDRGYSSVLCHNDRGRQFFERAGSCLEVYDADLDLLIQHDGKYAISSIPYTAKREAYFQLIKEEYPIDKVTKRVIPIKIKNKLLGKAKGSLYAAGLIPFIQHFRRNFHRFKGAEH